MVGVVVEYKSVPIEQLRSRESQVRKEFDQEFLDESAFAVSGTDWKAIVRPSGDHTGDDAPLGASVRARASPPSIEMR